MLEITVQSFSYKKGIPKDNSGNGGGFVFDCRGILNPGRIEEYKTQSGRDEAVQIYLENETKIPQFLASIWAILDISIENYLDRNCAHLQINFGCTGGQHRSVYSTEKTVEYIQKKYKNIRIIKNHLNEENWVKSL